MLFSEVSVSFADDPRTGTFAVDECGATLCDPERAGAVRVKHFRCFPPVIGKRANVQLRGVLASLWFEGG